VRSARAPRLDTRGRSAARASPPRPARSEHRGRHVRGRPGATAIWRKVRAREETGEAELTPHLRKWVGFGAVPRQASRLRSPRGDHRPHRDRRIAVIPHRRCRAVHAGGDPRARERVAVPSGPGQAGRSSHPRARCRGELRRRELRRCGLTDNALFIQLRERGVFSIDDLRYVLYEPKRSTTGVGADVAAHPDPRSSGVAWMTPRGIRERVLLLLTPAAAAGISLDASRYPWRRGCLFGGK
jgi:hypothetical protein